MSRASFDRLDAKITREYEERGYSKSRAERIGRATAGKVAHRKWAKKGIPAEVRRQRACVRDGMKAHQGETGAQHRRSFAAVTRKCAERARARRRGR